MTIPIVLLTGFLGSGKTTLLNTFLRISEFRNSAVIINEAGAVGIDHLLVEFGREDIILLEDGCLCCRMRGSLISTLSMLEKRREETGPSFERVVLETSGLADPSALLRTMVADVSFNRKYTVAGITTVVDALHFSSTARRHPEALAQVAMADRILITKADLASATVVGDVVQEICGLQPTAEYHVVTGVGSAPLLWHDPLAPKKQNASTGFIASGHSEAVATASVRFRGELSQASIDDWLDYMTDVFGHDLLRLKGILQVEGVPSPIVLHGVQGLVYSPGLLSNSSEAIRENRMVLIAMNIEKEDLDNALTELARLAVINAEEMTGTQLGSALSRTQ